jgi:hypothetical protein
MEEDWYLVLVILLFVVLELEGLEKNPGRAGHDW